LSPKLLKGLAMFDKQFVKTVGRVDYWLGAHHATAGSKERVGGVGAHEKWRRTE